MVLTFAVGASFIACGEDETVLAAGTADAGAESGADASIEPPAERPCDLDKPFDAPKPVGGLATAEHREMAARFSADERLAYYQRIEPIPNGFAGRVYVATRANNAVDFSSKAVTAPVFEDFESFTTPAPAPDGKSLFFTRTDPRTATFKIWRASASESPTKLVDMRELAGPVNEGESQSQPYVIENGTMYFSRDDAQGLEEFYRATRASTGEYIKVVAVRGLEMSAGHDNHSPVVTADELTIYWSSNRLAAAAGTDIFVARREDTASPFSNVRVVSELSTPTRNESPNFVSADGCRLYFTSLSENPYESDVLMASKPK